MEEITKDWLVGFIEGEGNFNVALSRSYKKKNPSYPFEYYPILQFRIFLHKDDAFVLQKIKNFLSVGKIYKKDCTYARKQGTNTQDQVCYYITSSKDLRFLMNFFNNCNFHTKKKMDKDAFFEILNLKLNKDHLKPEGYNKIISLANNMNSKNRNSKKIFGSPNN